MVVPPPNTDEFCGWPNTELAVFGAFPNADGVVFVFPPPNVLGAAGVPNAEGVVVVVFDVLPKLDCPKTEPPFVPPALLIADANEVGCELANAENPTPPPFPEPAADVGLVVEAPAPNGLGPALANAPKPEAGLITPCPPPPNELCPKAGCPKADVALVVVLADVVDVCPNELCPPPPKAEVVVLLPGVVVDAC